MQGIQTLEVSAMKVLVCGGRDFWDEECAYSVLDALNDESPITCVIEGGAYGADRLARAWAKERGIHNQTYSADWALHGRAAGPIRNALMLSDGRPDLVVAFPGGRGTADMVRRAGHSGIDVHIVPQH
jgi:hypothetical protein